MAVAQRRTSGTTRSNQGYCDRTLDIHFNKAMIQPVLDTLFREKRDYDLLGETGGDLSVYRWPETIQDGGSARGTRSTIVILHFGIIFYIYIYIAW